MDEVRPKGKPCIVYSNSSRKKFDQSPLRFGLEVFELYTAVDFSFSFSSIFDDIIFKHRIK